MQQEASYWQAELNVRALVKLAWLVRTDTNGTPLWNYTYGGADNEFCSSVVECVGGDLTLAGFTLNSGVGEEDSGPFEPMWWVLRNGAKPMGTPT